MAETTKIAVLDDNTRDADVIGYAATAEEAADVYMAYMIEKTVLGDDETLQRPTFVYRTETSVTSPAFEPLV